MSRCAQLYHLEAKNENFEKLQDELFAFFLLFIILSCRTLKGVTRNLECELLAISLTIFRKSQLYAAFTRFIALPSLGYEDWSGQFKIEEGAERFENQDGKSLSTKFRSLMQSYNQRKH